MWNEKTASQRDGRITMVKGLEIYEDENGKEKTRCAYCGEDLENFEEAMDHFDECDPMDYIEDDTED